MLRMARLLIAFIYVLSRTFLWASDEKPPSYPTFAYEVARTHEIKPHRPLFHLRASVPDPINSDSHSRYLPQAM